MPEIHNTQKLVNFRMDEATLAQFKSIAEGNDRTLSAELRRVVKEHIKSNTKDKK